MAYAASESGTQIEDKDAASAGVTNSADTSGTQNVTAPKKTKVKKAVSKKKKSLKIKLKKVKGADGYKVQICKNKKFRKKKTKTVYRKKNKFNVRKLKSGRRYYVRAKAYIIVNGKKLYSRKWSKIKRSKKVKNK